MDTIKINKKNTKVISHMGLGGLECENTNAAFVAAGNRRYYGIETDLHVTSDGKFVIIHDDNTKRVSGVDLVVDESTYEELKKIQLYDVRRGPYENVDHPGRRSDLVIPTLDEYIGICKRYEKVAVLELKNYMEEDKILLIIEAIKDAGYLNHIIFISFSWENLATIKKALPDQTVQFLTDQCDDQLIEKLRVNQMDLDIEYSHVTLELVEKLHKNNIKINCWTCDEKEKGELLVEYGVDYITTNILE